MTRRQRMYAAIGHREGDRVPKGEIDIAPPLVARLLGKPKAAYLPECVPFEDAVQVRKLLRMDLACVVLNTPASVNVGVDERGRELVRDYLGNVRVCDTSGVLAACIRDPAIMDSKGISTYEFPCVDGVSGASICAWSGKTDFFIFALISGVFETARYLCGLENFCIWSRTCTESLQDLLQKAAVFQSELARKAIMAGAHAVLVSEDFANNKATFFSPSTLRAIVFPAINEMVTRIKQEDVPVFVHSDGNVNEVLPDIVRCGFDGLQSLQPSAGMSLDHVKREYGDRLCLMGNIDLDHVLPFGTREEVCQAVKEAIEIAAPGGGYILSTCNALTQDIPPENAVAMYEAGDVFGINHEFGSIFVEKRGRCNA
ncbi:MAG: hypothetical protein KAW89_03450 [Armatimonadetes bacterium]|nr:hypothetical protein [Armatimonadota bacterium]